MKNILSRIFECGVDKKIISRFNGGLDEARLRNLLAELEKKLPDDLLAIFKECMYLSQKRNSKETDYYLKEGFRLGMLLGLECSDEQKLLQGL